MSIARTCITYTTNIAMQRHRHTYAYTTCLGAAALAHRHYIFYQGFGGRLHGPNVYAWALCFSRLPTEKKKSINSPSFVSTTCSYNNRRWKREMPYRLQSLLPIVNVWSCAVCVIVCVCIGAIRVRRHIAPAQTHKSARKYICVAGAYPITITMDDMLVASDKGWGRELGIFLPYQAFHRIYTSCHTISNPIHRIGHQNYPSIFIQCICSKIYPSFGKPAKKTNNRPWI